MGLHDWPHSGFFSKWILGCAGAAKPRSISSCCCRGEEQRKNSNAAAKTLHRPPAPWGQRENPTRSAPSLLLITKGSHEHRNIKVAKWKLFSSRIWIVEKKKFHAFKNLYAECTRGILTGRGCGDYQNNLSRSPSLHVILTPSITIMSVAEHVLAFASPNLVFTDK